VKKDFPISTLFFKWKSGYHNKSSEKYMLLSKRYLRRSADKHEKNFSKTNPKLQRKAVFCCFKRLFFSFERF